MSIDIEIRTATFNWLTQQMESYGDVLPRGLLRKGFNFKGDRIPLVSPQGIFKPKSMDLPLTITTTANGPYKDSFTDDDLLLYKYRGTDPYHRDNVGLREVKNKRLPLVYFHGVIPGKYLAIFPVFIIDDNPEKLEFTVAADDRKVIYDDFNQTSLVKEERRRYVTREVKTRLHQRGFRERVLKAYKEQCAFCHFKHINLLDAAHIVPDSEDEGTIEVQNGMALCKIHHAAFDQNIIGVTPDYEIKVRKDVLDEIDGPMLKHGIQEMHNQKLILPASKMNYPNKDKLAWRYDKFLSV